MHAGAHVTAGTHMLLCLSTGQVSLFITRDITEYWAEVLTWKPAAKAEVQLGIARTQEGKLSFLQAPDPDLVTVSLTVAKDTQTQTDSPQGGMVT